MYSQKVCAFTAKAVLVVITLYSLYLKAWESTSVSILHRVTLYTMITLLSVSDGDGKQYNMDAYVLIFETSTVALT